jgi:hypothetical protein
MTNFHSIPSRNSTGETSAEDANDLALTEKRRRNARASARFRDRRKQREREMRQRCEQLEQRVMELESLLACTSEGKAQLAAAYWRAEAELREMRILELERQVSKKTGVSNGSADCTWFSCICCKKPSAMQVLAHLNIATMAPILRTSKQHRHRSNVENISTRLPK